jgi:predicted metal-dependent peptidase
MATNGKQHFFNPDFVTSLNENHKGVATDPRKLIEGVQCHESEHDARGHGWRRGNRDPKEWNIACDYAINIDLIDEGFELPKGALIDPKYRGMSAEDIFRSRELDKRQQQPPQQPDADDSDDDQNDSDDQNDEQGNDDASDDDSSEAGDDAGDDEAGDDDSSEGGDSPADDSDSDAGDDAGSGAGDSDADSDDSDSDSDAQGGAASAAPNDDGSSDKPQQSSGDPGACGEVLDNVGDVAEQQERDVQWDTIRRQAASLAKAAGTLPGYVSRDIERANNPPRDWRDELREFAEQGALRIETWNRPNRRFIHSRLVLPSTQKDGVNKAVFIIDTSGSCDDIALACVNDEAQQLLDDGIVDQVVVLYGDTRLTREDEYSTGDEIEFDPKGGGGTDMEPMFTHVAEMHDDASLIVCFTDLEFYKSCGEEPHCPVLFAVHGYPQNVERLMKTAPWGARCIDVGAH